MAFNTAPGRAEYTASAAQTIFTFPFKIFDTSDVKVYLTPAGQTADDTADLLIETTGYSITINGDNGGDVTLTSGASLNDSITLVRELPTDRDTEYQQNGDLTAEALNEDQDYQTYLILDGATVSERALTVPDSVQSFDTEIPSPVANRLLVFNNAADGFNLLDTSSTGLFNDAFIVESVAAMVGVDPNQYGSVIARGYYIANDGGGGLFNYDATQSAVNNGGTIIDGWVRQYSGAVYAKWFGIKADGNDETTAFNNLVAFINSNDGVAISFPHESEILLNGTIDAITVGVTFIGNNTTLKIPNSNLSFSNASYHTFVLASDCSSYYFDMSTRDTVGVEVGDIFTITSDTLWRHDNRGVATYGELQKVAFLPDSNTNVLIALEGEGGSGLGDFDFYEEYTTITNSEVNFYKSKKLNISDLTIDGQGTAERALSITGYDNPIIKQVNIISFGDTGSGVSKCYAPLFDGCTATTTFINYTTSGTGYGVQFAGCRGAKFVNGTCLNVRRGVDYSGDFPSIGGGVYNSHFDNCNSSAFGTHGAAYGIQFNDNAIGYAQHGAFLRGENCTVSNNTIRECSHIATIQFGYGNNITGNRVEHCLAIAAYYHDAIEEKTNETALDLSYDVVSNNIADTITYGLIRFDVTSTNKKLNGFIIKDNTATRIEGGSTSAAITSTTSGVDLTGMTIGKTCVMINNHIDFTSSYSSFFDKNVTIELDGCVNACWYDNLSDIAVAMDKLGGTGAVSNVVMIHNSFNIRKGLLQGQLTLSFTISGGGIDRLNILSDIFTDMYGDNVGSYINAATKSKNCFSTTDGDGVVIAYNGTTTSDTWADGNYVIGLDLNIQSSDYRTAMPNN